MSAAGKQLMRLLTSLAGQPASQLELRRLIDRSCPVTPTGREWLIKKRFRKIVYIARNVTIFQCSFLWSFLSDLKHNCFFACSFPSNLSITFYSLVFCLSRVSFDFHIWSVLFFRLCFVPPLVPTPPPNPLHRKKKTEFFAWKDQVAVRRVIAQISWKKR